MLAATYTLIIYPKLTGLFRSSLSSIPLRIKRKEKIDGTIRLRNQYCDDYAAGLTVNGI